MNSGDDVRQKTGSTHGMSDITRGVTCGSCERETFAFERYCHRCGHDRWEGDA